MPKKTENPKPAKAAKKPKPVTAELLAGRLEGSTEGAEAVKLLVQAALSGRHDLLSAALLKMMTTALTEQPKKRGRPKAIPAPPKPVSVAPMTQAQIEAEEAKIPAAVLIQNLTQPARPEDVLREVIGAQLKPSYMRGQRVWSLKPTWKGRPLTSIRETWVQALQTAGMDTSRLVLQVVQGQLVVNLNGLGGR